MPARPRLLLISRNPPTGQGAGARIRAGFFLRSLLVRYEVHVLVISPEMTEAERAQPLLRQCASVTVDGMDWASRRRQGSYGPGSGVTGYLWGVLKSDPQGAPSLTWAEGRALCGRLPASDFDAVVAIRLSMARAAQQLIDWGLLTARHRVFDLDDIESRLVARERRLIRASVGRAVTLGRHIEQWRLGRLEARLIRDWDQVYVCSEADRSDLARQYPGAKVYAVPNTCAATALEPPEQAQARQIMFIGSMRYAPNDDAAMYFCTDVLPRLCELLGGAPVTRIVGMGPSERVQALHGRQGIEVAGAVDDLQDAYRRASLVVVPIRFGGGTRIKIIEALAAGRPVVSTTLGAEGLGLRDGVELLLADQPQAFATACARVLQEPALWHALVRRGREAYETRYAPEVVTQSFLRVFEPLLADAKH